MIYHAKVFEVLIFELSAIVGYDRMRESESVNYRFLNEILHLAFYNLCQRFGLHPFRKVIDDDDQKFFLSECWRERTKYVNSPLRKQPRGCDRCQLRRRLTLGIGIPLAWLAPSDELSCVLLHCWLRIPFSKNLIGEGLAPQVVPVDPFVNFLKCIIGIGGSQAL